MSLSSLSTSSSTSSECSSQFYPDDVEIAAFKMEHELEIIHNWFSLLSDAERTAAFSSIAEVASVREIEPLIQTLKSRKNELWRQQQSIAIHHGHQEKKAMPSFPHGSKDTKWLRKWLRALRLHKYEGNLEGLSPKEVSALDDEGLQRLGVDTVGARKKLIRAMAT